MEKWVIILTAIILVLCSFGIYTFVQSRRLRSANVKAYNALECLSTCTTRASAGMLVLEDGCVSVCESYYSDVSLGIIDSNKFLINSVEHFGCLTIYEEEGGEEYKDCLSEIIPMLRLKYKYLEQ